MHKKSPASSALCATACYHAYSSGLFGKHSIPGFLQHVLSEIATTVTNSVLTSSDTDSGQAVDEVKVMVYQIAFSRLAFVALLSFSFQLVPEAAVCVRLKDTVLAVF